MPASAPATSPRRATRGKVAAPRRAALEGIAKMRANLALGLTQGVLLPLARPDHAWLDSLATNYAEAPSHLQAQALSASAMWAANAATVSPAPDTADGRCHLSVANLVTMPHRSHEWPGTLAQLQLAFADPLFAVHGPVPAPVRRRGRGQSHAALRRARPAGRRGLRLWRLGRPLPRAPAPRRQAWPSRGGTGSMPVTPCSSSSRSKPSPPARSTTTWSPSPMNASCSRTNSPLPTRSVLRRPARHAARGRDRRSPRLAGQPRRRGFLPICSTPSS